MIPRQYPSVDRHSCLDRRDVTVRETGTTMARANQCTQLQALAFEEGLLGSGVDPVTVCAEPRHSCLDLRDGSAQQPGAAILNADQREPPPGSCEASMLARFGDGRVTGASVLVVHASVFAMRGSTDRARRCSREMTADHLSALASKHGGSVRRRCPHPSSPTSDSHNVTAHRTGAATVHMQSTWATFRLLPLKHGGPLQ